MSQGAQVENVSEIMVDPKPGGFRAVFLVETRNAGEARDVVKLFEDISDYLQVRQLSKGNLISFAVQAQDADQRVLDEIRAMLTAKYGFVALHSSFDGLIYRIITELCKDTNSKLLPIPRCDICGKVDPFPETIVSFADSDGSTVLSRDYCSTCTAEASATNNRDFLLSLLSADKKDFSGFKEHKLVRSPSRKQRIKFRIEPAHA